ncbi:MAG: alpha/beta hydrolase [Chloroflexi bacterium]|nr:alpha/beta hydrolase [Chloroflexota bacterium]
MTTAMVGVRDIFVRANGLRHHLIARGAPGAPVVMMIHGLAGQAHTFDAIAARLAAKYHVYALDVRGRGESEWGPPDGYHVDNYVADLEAVRGALGLDRMALVGTSMGGMIAMNYAPRFPERVTRAVLNDVGPEIDPKGLARIVQYVGHAPDAFGDMKAVVKYYKENYGPMIERLPEDQVAEFARWNVRKSDSGVYVWKMDPAIRTMAPVQPSTAPWDAFRGMKCPVLVLRGGESDILSREIAGRMVAAIADCRLVEVPGVGHAPLLTEPESVAALESFLGA